MFKYILILCLYCTVTLSMQYIELLTPCSVHYEDIDTFIVSNATKFDDSPHDLIELPFDFQYYQHTSKYIWISPNGCLHMSAGLPCFGMFGSGDCGIYTLSYHNTIMPYLNDLDPSKSVGQIEYSKTNDYVVVSYRNITSLYTNENQIFYTVLYKDGSIHFVYKQFSWSIYSTFPFNNNILIGVRPSKDWNYTLSSYVDDGSFSEWPTLNRGVYVPMSQLYTLYQRTLALNHTEYIYERTPFFCLMPTDLCASPTILEEDSINNVTFSGPSMGCLRHEGITASCSYSLYNSEYTIYAIYQEESSSFSCLLSTPILQSPRLPINITISIILSSHNFSKTISFSTPLVFSIIPSTIESKISTSPFISDLSSILSTPLYCNGTSLNEQCNLCGRCQSISDQYNTCLGTDSKPFSYMINDCIYPYVMDTNNTCCLPSNLDCNGICYGESVTATEPNYRIQYCCIIPSAYVDCAGTCMGTAYYDECGICSGGLSNHIANSDKDCNGICFGNATYICLPEFIQDKYDLMYHYHLSNRDNNTISHMINFTNISPYVARFFSYSILRSIEPSPYLAFYFYDEISKQFYPIISPLTYEILPNTSIFLRLQVSLNSFLTSLRSYYDALWLDNIITVYFSSLRNSSLSAVPYNVSLSLTISECEYIAEPSACSNIPNCMVCTYSIRSVTEFQLNRQVLASTTNNTSNIFIPQGASIPYFQVVTQIQTYLFTCADQVQYADDITNTIIPRNYTDICKVYNSEAVTYMNQMYHHSFWEISISLSGIILLISILLFIFMIIRDRRRVNAQRSLRYELFNYESDGDLSDDENINIQNNHPHED